MTGTCPSLDGIERDAEHVAGCPSCRIVVELLAERRRGLDEREARGECDRFELLLAAREDGTIGGPAGELLDSHLRTCAACMMVAQTRPPQDEAASPVMRAIPTAAYALGREIGRGGMARVLAAEDVRIGRSVAVKEPLGRSPTLAARFEREAYVTARLQHPGIVPIYEIGRWPDGTPFYAMRMVEGSTLRDVLRDAPTVDQRLALLPAVIAAAEAIAFAHGKSIIHRDLTPNNVLVGAHGDTVVIDWGLAKDLAQPEDETATGPFRDGPRSAELTSAGAVIGTAAYMPPEQASGESVDKRADVYALGALLYHLLSGAPPYAGGSDVLARVRSGPPQPIGAVAPGAPRDLVSIVDKAMSRDPAARYADAAALVAELRRFQTGRLVEAHHYSRGERTRRWLGRHRVLAAVSAVVVVAGAIGLAGVLRERDRAESGERAAETSAALLLEETGRQELLAGHSTRAAIWLSASYTAGNTRPALRVLLAHAMRDLEARERELACEQGGERTEVSPDQTLVLRSCGDAVVIWRISDGTRIATIAERDISLTRAAFSPDGAHVVGWGGTEIRIANVATGVIERALVGHEKRVLNAMFSRDGTRVITSGEDATVRIWSASTGAELVKIATEAPERAAFIGDAVVSTSATGRATVWDGATKVRVIENGALVTSTDLERNQVDRAVACGVDGVARIWNVATGAMLYTLPAHSDVIWTCELSADRAQLLTTSADGFAKVWDVATGHLVRAVAPGGVVNAGAFAGGNRIVTGSLVGGIRVWDVGTGALLAADDSVPVSTAQLRVAGDRILAGEGDSLRIWNHLGDRAAHRTYTPPAGTHVVAPGAFSADRLLVTSADGDVTLRDVEHDRALTSGLRLPVTSSGELIAARVADGIAIARGRDGQTIRTIPDHRAISDIRLGLDRLVATAPDGIVVWDIARGTELARWDAAWSLRALSTDGTLALMFHRDAGEVEQYAAIWQVSPPQQLHVLAIGRDILREAQFARDGSYVVGRLGPDFVGTLAIWDVRTGGRAMTLSGAISAQLDPTGDTFSVAFADHHELWRYGEHSPLATFGDLGQVVDTTGTILASLQTAGGTVELLDRETGRILDAIPYPRVAEISATGYSLGGGALQLSADGTRALIATSEHASWISIERESRPPAEVAAIVERHARWRLEGTRLVERAAPRATLAGRITRRGAPVAGASVTVASPLGGRLVALSDASGSYRFDGLPPALVRADAASIATGAFTGRHALVLHAGDNQLDLELELAGSIEGRLVDATGKPAAGIEVFALCRSPDDSGNAVTDRDGRFAIHALAGGCSYEMHPHHGPELVPAEDRSVLVKDGDAHVAGVELRLR